MTNSAFFTFMFGFLTSMVGEYFIKHVIEPLESPRMSELFGRGIGITAAIVPFMYVYEDMSDEKIDKKGITLAYFFTFFIFGIAVFLAGIKRSLLWK